MIPRNSDQYRSLQPTRDLFAARAAVGGTPANRPQIHLIEQQVIFVIAFGIISLVIVAFLANGAGAGTQHHHLVRSVVAGLFVVGAGMIGLILMNAACGCVGLNQDTELKTAQAAAVQAKAIPATTAIDPHLDRQTEHYRRRVYRETQETAAAPLQGPSAIPTPPVAVPTRPAPTGHAPANPTAAASRFESEAAAAAANTDPQVHVRRRRARRA